MKQWVVAKLNKQRASSIADNYGLSPILSTLLDIREIVDEKDIKDFLYNENEIADPFEIKDMDKAVLRIKSAVQNGEKICVYGDFDADGVTATALLYSYLEAVGADVIYYIPDREKEGYGMNMSAVDTLCAENVNLIVTVDNGISALEEIEYAKTKGIDTVVTDHHVPSENLPDAVAVVDLHREDCNSKFKMLSGVGVAFKLVMAMEGEYCDINMLLDNYCDLVSIGTIGDIVPLVGENRVFVKRGINSIENNDRIGISAIIKESGLSGKDLTAGNISFTIVPRINAVGRLGESKKSVSLLLSEDEEYAADIACMLGEDNVERQKIEKEILESINTMIAHNPSVIQDRVIIIDGDGWHRGVVGIVSSRVKDIYGKPCIVISKDDDVCRGSGRSVEGFDLWSAVDACSEYLVRYGGHPMAVGLSIDSDKVDDFRRAINNYASSVDVMPFQKLNIDCKLNPAYIDVELAKQLNYLQPYGAGNPTPVFEVCNLKLLNIIPLSNDKHLRLVLTNSNCRITAMKFFTSRLQFPYTIGDFVDLAVTVEVNKYNGNESLSIIIKDIKFAGKENEIYLESQRLYERFCKGERLTKSQLLTLIPSRDDFALVYRFLRKTGICDYPVEVICHRLGDKLSYGKVRVIFEAMNELGLIALYEDMYKLEVNVLNVDKKVNLNDSTLIKQLKEVYQSE